MDKQERFYFDIWIALLSMLSGMVNVLTLLLFLIPATHFTGNITQFVLALNEGEWSVVIRLLGMILCFGGGGVLSGVLFSKKKFEPTKRYGLLLLIRGQKKERWKVLFYFTSMLFFGIGGTISFQFFKLYSDATIILISVGYMILGFYYFSFRKLFFH